MTLRQLKKLANYWKKRLNIIEWNINVDWSSESEKDLLGSTYIHAEELTADVYINPNQETQEETLVHELLHIVYEGDQNSEAYSIPLEKAINRITKALLWQD